MLNRLAVILKAARTDKLSGKAAGRGLWRSRMICPWS